MKRAFSLAIVSISLVFTTNAFGQAAGTKKQGNGGKSTANRTTRTTKAPTSSGDQPEMQIVSPNQSTTGNGNGTNDRTANRGSSTATQGMSPNSNIRNTRNQDIEVENDETHWVGHDKKKITSGNKSATRKTRTETVNNNENITIGNNRKRVGSANRSTNRRSKPKSIPKKSN